MDVFVDPRFDDLYRRYPISLVDVGARGGLKANWAAARRHLRLIGFEPDPVELERLVERTTREQSSSRYLGTALHSHRSTLHLHVARDRGLSSIFPPNRPFLDTFPDAERFDTLSMKDVDADALDDVVAANGVGDVDFIKADTQGSELLVLKGAERTLRASVIGVEVEVEFAPIYSGQPLFADVDAYMRELGYLLFDLRPCYWKRGAGRAIGGPRGQIIWADALYLRDVAGFGRAIAGLPADARAAKVLKAVSISLLYGYYDYALEIITALGAHFSPEDRKVIAAALLRSGAVVAQPPRFPGRRRIASVLHRLWKLVRERSEGWSVSEAEIGNLR
jgi:FkbM family methyltransferase